MGHAGKPSCARHACFAASPPHAPAGGTAGCSPGPSPLCAGSHALTRSRVGLPVSAKPSSAGSRTRISPFVRQPHLPLPVSHFKTGPALSRSPSGVRSTRCLPVPCVSPKSSPRPAPRRPRVTDSAPPLEAVKVSRGTPPRIYSSNLGFGDDVRLNHMTSMPLTAFDHPRVAAD